jgi:hypothetical protein
MTNGRKTKAVIILDSGHIALAALQPETIAGRMEAQAGGKAGETAKRGSGEHDADVE